MKILKAIFIFLYKLKADHSKQANKHLNLKQFIRRLFNFCLVLISLQAN